MNDPIPNALANTILLADHDEATQRAVVDAVEKLVYNYLQKNMYEISTNVVAYQQAQIERISLRALRTHLVNSNHLN
jgi:HD superfamily phosphohydrolase YqeK